MNLFRARRILTGVFLQNILKLLERHLYILLLIPLFLIASDLSRPGITIGGDFPYLDTPDYAYNRLWLWVEKGSIDGFEFVTRFPIVGLMYLLSYVNVNSEWASKAMILLGFFLSSFTFYFSFLLFSKNRFYYPVTLLRISAIIGSLFYAYNVWAFNRIHHWYLWIGYSILPLFFISSFLYLKNPRDWKYLILGVFLWSIASSTPHMTVFYGIILVSMTIGFIIHRLYRKRTRLALHLGISFLVIFFCYIAVNIYWIYPYYLTLGTQVLTPNYEVTEDSILLLSREGSFLNTFRILAYWLNTDVVKEHAIWFFLWLCASVAIPVIAFSALLLKRSIRYTLIFSSLGLIGIFLAMGKYSPFDYYQLVLYSPILAKFGWILRDSDKLSFLVTFAYSFLVGIVCCAVFSIISSATIREEKKMLLSGIAIGFFTILVIGSIFLVSSPFYETRISSLKPTLLPVEFDRLNQYLSTVDTEKVYFIPYPLYETAWDNNSRVGDVYQTHSAKASIESTEYSYPARNYYNYLENSIYENRTKNIGNLIHPLGTSYVIFHNDTWNKIRNSYDKNSIELLKKLYFIEDMKNTENIGLFKIFKITRDGKNNTAGEVFLPNSNFAIISDLSVLSSLGSLTSFDSLKSSVLFMDDIRTKQGSALKKSINYLLLNRPSTFDEIALFFVDDKYVVTPFDATYRYEPSEVWSKARARDPIHAEYHPYLNNFGVENWDLDYGKGMVITSAVGAKISIPVLITNENDDSNHGEDGQFSLFMRYLKNQKGGQIKIYLDDKLVSTVDTLDKVSSNFVWENINSVINLTKGKHILTLENVIGLNAVNICALVPPEELSRIREETSQLLADNKGVIYLLEAESNFSNKKGADSDLTYLLIGNDSAAAGGEIRNKASSQTFNGQFKVPENSDLAILQFSAKKNLGEEGGFSIKKMAIAPANIKNTMFSSDFEVNKVSVPLAVLRHSDWINYDKDLLSTSLDVKSPLDGNRSLLVDIKAGVKNGWNVLSTDLIPIDANGYYNATLTLSAKGVKQLHSRVLYYNSEGKEITGETVYIFKGKDGTFRDTFRATLLPPVDARYLKLQILTLSANPNPSSYILDNVKLDELLEPYSPANKYSYNPGKGKNNIEENNFDAETKDNSTHYMISTNPISLKENQVYNYTITTDSKNVTSLTGVALFKSSKDVVQNFTRYGNIAGSGGVLSLSNGSQISTNLNILKSANYTIATRAMSCQTCSLRLELVDEAKIYNGKGNNDATQISNVTLDNKSIGFSWKYINSTYLRQGKYDLNIYSNSRIDLDAVAIYSDRNKGIQSPDDNGDGKLEIFNSDRNITPALISAYEKINPTKHIVQIKNATVPYVLAFAESYDPLWTAYAENNIQNSSVTTTSNNNFKVNSIPLYSVINGFAINKTGNYTLIIEYEPQKWFIRGGIVSTVAILIITIAILLFVKRKTLEKLLKTAVREK